MKYAIIIAFVLLFISCAWDNAEDLYGIQDCPPEGISYSQTIAPIIATNCAISGCHVTGQQRPTLETYEQIAANADRIMTRTFNGTMPPSASGKSLSLEEIEAIACWVGDGALEN